MARSPQPSSPLSGFFLGPFAGAFFATRQDHAPEPLRAQVFTLGAGLKTTAAAAGAALAGTISATTTATRLLLVAACRFLAGTAGALLLSRPDFGTRVPRPVSRLES